MTITCPSGCAVAPTTVTDMFAAESGTDTALVVALVLCAVAFAALVLVLYRVLVALADLRSDLEIIEAEVVPAMNRLVDELRDATRETRDVIDTARGDLERFDRVLGSAESISEAVADTSRIARTVLSTPVIKVAAAASGTRRALSVLRRRR